MQAEEISRVLRSALPDDTPFRPDLHERARAQGKRRRIRRQMTTAGATAALMAVAGTAVALNGARSRDGAQALGTANASSTSSPAPSTSPLAPPGSAIDPRIDDAAVVARLQEQFNASQQGSTLKLVADQVDTLGWSGQLRLTEPDGSQSALFVSIQHLPSLRTPTLSSDNCSVTLCVLGANQITLPDGTKIWTYQHTHVTPHRPPPTPTNPALALIGSGPLAEVDALNQGGDYQIRIEATSADPNATVPSLDLLKQIATDPTLIHAGLAAKLKS